MLRVACGIQLPSRDPRLGAHAPCGLPAGDAGLHEPLDRRPSRGHDGVVRILRPGPGTHAPCAGSTRPRSPTAGPAHDDHDLAARGDRPVRRPFRELAEGPPHHRLVQLGQLPAHRAGTIRAAGLRKVPQRGRGPAGRLEQDAATLVGADPGQALAPLAPAAGQEALEGPARSREPRRGHGGQHGRGPRDRHDPSAGSGPGGDQPLARIGDDGRPGVRHERQVRAGREVGQQVTLLRRPAPGVVAGGAGGDLVAVQEPAGDPRVLGGDQRDGPQHLERPHRDVAQVADGRGDDVEDPAGRLGGVARPVGPAHDQDRAAEPGRRRGYR